MSEKKLTHLDADGQSHMVDVSDRDVAVRTAEASGHVSLSAEVITMLRDNPNIRMNFGEAGRKQSVSDYSWERVASDYISIMKNLSKPDCS